MRGQSSSWMVVVLLVAWMHTDAYRPTSSSARHLHLLRHQQLLHAGTDAAMPSTYIPIQIAVPRLKK